MYPAKTQINLYSTQYGKGSLYRSVDSLKAHTISEDADQTARMRSLIWVFAGRKSLIVGLALALSAWHWLLFTPSVLLDSNFTTW